MGGEWEGIVCMAYSTLSLVTLVSYIEQGYIIEEGIRVLLSTLI